VLAGLGGLAVAAGLGLAGLTDAGKVVGFLSFGADWDPTALLVLLAAMVVYGVAFRLIVRAPQGAAPPPDRRLLLGAVLFGVGWGATGLCPAPALAGAATGARPLVIFVAAMLAGMALFGLRARRGRTAAARTGQGAGRRPWS
jgi:uncharacterized membrane protein YedE/YeeE